MSEFDPTLITVYTYLQAISCFILAMMFAALLVRNAKTFKFPFVTMIASLLFVANLGFILQVIGYDMFVLLITSDGTNKQKSERFWIQWAGVFSGAHDLAFNCAHWTFSFEYYKIARSMPFALRGVALPHRMVVCQWTLNLVFMTLNILVPLFSSICDSVLIALFAKSFNQNVDTEGWTKAGIVFHLLVGLLQVISGLFLGYAIIKIRQFLGKGLSSTQISMQYFIMHIVVFVFFIISVIFYYVYFVINYIALAHLQKPSSEEITAMVTSLIVSCVCSFIAQAFMFSILWSFMKTDQKVMVEETASEKSTPERPRARSSWLLITDKPTEKEEIDCQETQTQSFVMSAKAAEHVADGLKIENYWNAEGTPKAENIDLAQQNGLLMSTHSLDPFGVDDKSNDLQAKMWNQFLQINMSENPLKNDAEFCVVATREVVKVSAMQYRAASLGIKFKPALFKSKTQIQINKEVPKQIRTATMKINRSNSTLDDLDQSLRADQKARESVIIVEGEARLLTKDELLMSKRLLESADDSLQARESRELNRLSFMQKSHDSLNC